MFRALSEYCLQTDAKLTGTVTLTAKPEGVWFCLNDQPEHCLLYTSPLLTSSDCEGAGEMFRVTTLDLENVPKNEDGTVDYTQDFFEKPVNLTVSGQLEAEAMAMAFGKVYTFGPTFRAEKSFTTRHAAEF